jgi:hypothetical protein
MSEEERRQTTKGIWMSKNKRPHLEAGMADNILVMDVEGTDGRERGEDQDFERKAALFALATSEVLIVNIWEHQVGLYQGANMGLLKTVFEVNLQLFVKDSQYDSSSIHGESKMLTGHSSIPRSLLFFVIRDHIGNTPLSNLRNTLLSDLSRLWDSISKPPGLENSKIHDYFDFAFVALPHKILMPDKFDSAVDKLSTRFREGYKDPKKQGLLNEDETPLLLPEYHRRIPADGFNVYAEGVWDQIVNNKDLDLPTQQELLAQFRCDEIAREVLLAFDESMSPLETTQARDIKAGTPALLPNLGSVMTSARVDVLKNFETEASRYHKGVYTRKREELQANVDKRLKDLFTGQLQAAHKNGIRNFSEAVAAAVKLGQKKGAQYDFAEIVSDEKKKAYENFRSTALAASVEGTSFSDAAQEFNLFRKELDQVSGQLRKEEMRRLATRVERWVRSRLGDSIGLEFNKIGSGRGGSGAPEHGQPHTEATEKGIWDRVWSIFTETVEEAEKRFTERAKSYDASAEEVEIGLWRLRRKSWGVLRAKIDEETMEGNLLLKLRENFEDRFRYDEQGVPRIWRPTDDIDGIFAKARDHTITLIPLLSKFRLARTQAPPPLDAWIGHAPTSVSTADEEDMLPIGGVDEDEGKSLEEETTILGDAKKADMERRFRKTADGVYVEAKRGALGGVTQTPWWMWGLLLVLGQNEIFAGTSPFFSHSVHHETNVMLTTVARNPFLILLMALLGAGAYVTYTLNLWGPIIQMTTAASEQGLTIAKAKLREWLVETETGRQALAMSSGSASGARRNATSTRADGDDGEDEAISLRTLDRDGKAKVEDVGEDEI